MKQEIKFLLLMSTVSLIGFLTQGQYEKLSANALRSVYLQGPFVAGFSSSNLGDSSPNIRGPVCVNTGEKCDYLNSSCPVGGVSYYYKHAVLTVLCTIYYGIKLRIPLLPSIIFTFLIKNCYL